MRCEEIDNTRSSLRLVPSTIVNLSSSQTSHSPYCCFYITDENRAPAARQHGSFWPRFTLIESCIKKIEFLSERTTDAILDEEEEENNRKEDVTFISWFAVVAARKIEQQQWPPYHFSTTSLLLS